MTSIQLQSYHVANLGNKAKKERLILDLLDVDGLNLHTSDNIMEAITFDQLSDMSVEDRVGVFDLMALCAWRDGATDIAMKAVTNAMKQLNDGRAVMAGLIYLSLTEEHDFDEFITSWLDSENEIKAAHPDPVIKALV